jgi:hypothetical protein
VAISALLYAGLALLAFGSVSLVYSPRFLGIATRTGALVAFAAGFLAVVAAFTNTGQIGMLRRLAGSPVRGESYFRSDIAVGRVGQDQSAPHREFD